MRLLIKCVHIEVGCSKASIGDLFELDDPADEAIEMRSCKRPSLHISRNVFLKYNIPWIEKSEMVLLLMYRRCIIRPATFARRCTLSSTFETALTEILFTCNAKVGLFTFLMETVSLWLLCAAEFPINLIDSHLIWFRKWKLMSATTS